MGAKQFYSQRGEDKWIFENIDLPENGMFLDIGCNDPINNNNTYAFEKYLGWRGIAIDINFVHAARWVKERPKSDFYAGAIIPDDWPIKTIEVLPDERNNGELIRAHISHEGGTVSVCGIKVEDLLNYCPSPYILSIDVEGMEKTILHDIFKACKPAILIVEHSTLGLPFDEKLLPFIIANGYTLRHTTDFNYILTL